MFFRHSRAVSYDMLMSHNFAHCTMLTPARASLQIKVPPNLGEVLKAYTKEVIRVQPEDLIAFSAE